MLKCRFLAPTSRDSALGRTRESVFLTKSLDDSDAWNAVLVIFLSWHEIPPSAWHAQGAGPTGAMVMAGISVPITSVVIAIFGRWMSDLRGMRLYPVLIHTGFLVNFWGLLFPPL